MPNNPLVSVIVPTLDRAQLVTETVASVVSQDYSNWELIVVDDDSRDNSMDVLEGIARKDNRIVVKRRSSPTDGAPTCRNEGAALARGEYLIFLDSDDLLAPTCISNRIRVMTDCTELDFGVFNTQTFINHPGDEAYLWNEFTDHCDLDRFLRLDTPWGTSGPIYRRAYWSE